ncbi:sporulation protein YabP [Clostridium thermobutyricum]|uniref:Sporulation protein YabP n=2 Tax=Clostridium thermobutyricum TaxID=29372 RepID=N9WBF7_9CLOT|nr:sporulation protein YabP [Clostridium thermobutyricum]ENZ00346.1 sporulation protein YabP [Clostridium thermobutyricum]OPX47112.1 spore protein YabP [Clostridium thermobutyricum DSM 4928]
MDKTKNPIQTKVSSISLENRRKMLLTGVNEVLSFNDEKIILNTVLGKLNIKGQNLKMNKLDVKNGDVIVDGYITSLIYNNKKDKKKRSLIRLIRRKRVE